MKEKKGVYLRLGMDTNTLYSCEMEARLSLGKFALIANTFDALSFGAASNSRGYLQSQPSRAQVCAQAREDS